MNDMKKFSFKSVMFAGLLIFGIGLVNSQTKTCVSGNCESGSGRIKLPEYSNRKLQGYFINGTPMGETKIYNSDGSLFYTGPVKDF